MAADWMFKLLQTGSWTMRIDKPRQKHRKGEAQVWQKVDVRQVGHEMMVRMGRVVEKTGLPHKENLTLPRRQRPWEISYSRRPILCGRQGRKECKKQWPSYSTRVILASQNG